MPRLAGALWVLSLAACSRPAPVPEASAATSPDTGFALGLERGPGFGSCPVYALEIQGNGTGVLRATGSGKTFQQKNCSRSSESRARSIRSGA